MTTEHKTQRFNEVLHALLNQPLGKELINILKERMLGSENIVFGPTTTPDSDKFYLGRHSVYKDLIRLAETQPTKKENTND